ncbi:signal peptidase II [Mycoplasmopsis primatum]|uniref:signal peptidase II n=1 Tax=Mycoplasmopsis primatum TaxID=55604 RepID=UPI00068ED725|nr:signal peptidase II [Mycoplasmopsis primatum]
MANQEQNKDSFLIKIKNIFRKWINNLKHNYVSVLIKYALFVGLFVILLLFDQLTKDNFFNKIPDSSSASGFEGDTSIVYDYGLIGFRSVAHHGVTIFSNKELSKTGFNFIHFISILLLVFLLITPSFVKSNCIIIICALVAAGDVGNFIDRMKYNNTVLDIIYSPFLERWANKHLGTFNFADTYIVAGSALLIFYVILKNFMMPSKEDLYEENMINELLVDPIVIEQAKNKLSSKKSWVSQLALKNQS